MERLKLYFRQMTVQFWRGGEGDHFDERNQTPAEVLKRTCIRQEILSKPPGAERRERQIGGQSPAASHTSGSESPATHSHGLYCTTRPETKGDPKDKYSSLFLKPHAHANP